MHPARTKILKMKGNIEYELIVWEVVKTTSGISPAFKQCRQLVDGSGSLLDRLHDILAVVHCEAALSTLLKFSQVLLQVC
jgi:hypothetical protein